MPLLCYRSFYLTYLWTTKVKDIELYSFVIPDQAFAVIPENQGFCTPVYSCTPAGVLNITMYKNNGKLSKIKGEVKVLLLERCKTLLKEALI